MGSCTSRQDRPGKGATCLVEVSSPSACSGCRLSGERRSGGGVRSETGFTEGAPGMSFKDQWNREKLAKKRKRGFRGYPVATVAFLWAR